MRAPIAIISFLLIEIAICTQLTFYTLHEASPPLDLVFISAIVKAQSSSLNEAIASAQHIITEIERSVHQYCLHHGQTRAVKNLKESRAQKHEENRNSKSQEYNCEDSVETSRYSVRVKYQKVKNKLEFQGFVVAHEMEIKVRDSPMFGKLADDLLKNGVNKINEFKWESEFQVDGEEEAVEAGMEEARKMCKQIGKSLQRVVEVSQINNYSLSEPEPQDQEDQEEKQEQPQQEQQKKKMTIKQGLIYYKFVVDCDKP